MARKVHHVVRVNPSGGGSRRRVHHAIRVNPVPEVPNPMTGSISAQQLRPGDVIVMEDLGRLHVIEGPFRSTRGVRFRDEFGRGIILQPNERVHLEARENPMPKKHGRRHVTLCAPCGPKRMLARSNPYDPMTGKPGPAGIHLVSEGRSDFDEPILIFRMDKALTREYGRDSSTRKEVHQFARHVARSGAHVSVENYDRDSVYAVSEALLQRAREYPHLRRMLY